MERSISVSGNLWMAGCILMVLGAACAVIGMLLNYYGEQQEIYPGRAEARVVEILTEPRSGAAALSEFRHCQAAVFEFYAAGKLVRVKEVSDTYPCRYVLHQKVKLCYNPLNPTQYRILKRNDWKMAGKLAYAGGIAMLLLGGALFLLYAARIEI